MSGPIPILFTACDPPRYSVPLVEFVFPDWPNPSRVFLRYNSETDLAGRMKPLAKDASVRGRLEEAARHYVRQTFSREQSLAALAEIYTQFLQRKGALSD